MISRNSKYFIFLLLVISTLMWTNSPSLAIDTGDSIRIKFPEITITAGRILSKKALEYSPAQIITQEVIKNIGAWQVSEVVSFSPGIFIKSYGGLGGMKTISARGTTAQQTLIMIDGQRINSSQNGAIDLSILPISQIKEIEVIRGGLSALYGGNALGGVINIITESDFSKSGNKKDYTFIGKLFYGSFGDMVASISTTQRNEDMIFSQNIEYEHSSGNYKYSTNNNGLVENKTRQNAFFENLNGIISASKQIANSDYSAKAIFRVSNRGIPGPDLADTVINDKAGLKEKEVMLLMRANHYYDSCITMTSLLSTRINEYDYSSPNAFGELNKGIFEKFTNRDATLNLQLSKIDKTPKDSNGTFSGNIGIELNFADLRGTQLQPKVGDYIKRTQIGICSGIDYSFVLGEYQLSLQSGVRFDAVSDAGNAISPLVGIIFQPSYLPLKIRSQWSYNFRPPSFNEMYYLNYGALDLKPERSNSFNTGLTYSLLENINFGIEGFIINTKNQIISVPKSQISWSAKNFGSVLNRGIELSAVAELFNRNLNLSISYTRQEATDNNIESATYKKLIVYIPQELFSGMITYKIGKLSIGSNFQYTSFRYSMEDNSYESILPAEIIINIFTSYSLKIAGSDIDLRLECNNLSDEQYSVIKNYPMPGRMFRMGFRFDY